MNGTALTALRWERAVLILVVVFSGCFLWVSQVEAVLTAQSISGTVEVLLAGEQNWGPLTATMKLKTGDQVRTGPNSSVDLWFEDGSVLNLAAGTQIAISQLEVSTVQKSRVARFKLWWGVVTAKVTKLAFTENVCEVETETVVAGVKFSEMTVIQPQNTSQSEVIARQGLIEIRQIGEGTVKFSAFLSPRGVTGQLTEVGARLLLGVHKILQKITVETNIPLRINVHDDGKYLVKAENNSNIPINVESGGTVITLGVQALASFGAASGLKTFLGANGPMNASLSYTPRSPSFMCNNLSITLLRGNGTGNGRDLKVGEPNCLGGTRGIPQPPGVQGDRQLPPQPAGAEQPVVPGGPESPSPGGSDPPKPTVEQPVEQPPEDGDLPGEETTLEEEIEMGQEPGPEPSPEEEEEASPM